MVSQPADEGGPDRETGGGVNRFQPKFNSGPELRIGKQKKLRGLKGTTQGPSGKVKIIMRSGLIFQPLRLKEILPTIEQTIALAQQIKSGARKRPLASTPRSIPAQEASWPN